MPKKTLSTTCGFCSTGCNLLIVDDNQSAKVVPNPRYPVNLGSVCPKGFFSLEPLKAQDRAVIPYQRNNRGEFEPVDWDRALQAFTYNFKEIQKKYGRESVAFIGSGQLPNEESDVLVFIGANLAICHPVMWNRVKRNKNSPEIIIVDPRRTETSKRATQHYQINPEGLLTILYGIAHILIENDWIDSGYIKRNTIGYEAFQKHIRCFDPKTVSHICGLTEGQINKFAQTIHSGKRVSFWWSMGVNQNYQGVRCAQAIINLALMTGNMGRPGTGANSITGQCNAMGARIFSNTTSLLGGV